MKVFLNILWYFPYFGFLLIIPVGLLGLLLCLTVVGLPIGLGLLQIAVFLLAPHTSELVSQKDISAAKGEKRNTFWVVFSTIVRILYFPIGICVAFLYILYAVACFLSIIGIPNGLVVAKLIPSLFNPVGKVCVSGAIARKLKADKDQQEVDRYLGKKEPEPVFVPVQTPVKPETPSPKKENPDSPRYYSDERIDEVITNAKFYRTEIVEECKKEKEIRAQIAENLPEIEAMSEEKINEIVNYPLTYSPLIVRCAEVALEKLAKQRAAEEAAEKARQEEELRLQREAEEQKRKEQIQKITNFLNKWKYVIAGIVAIIAITSFSLWYTSDSHRYNVAVNADLNGDYDKVIEYVSKIDNENSKYFQPALILGLNVKELSEYSDILSSESRVKADKLQERLNKYVETTPLNEKSFFAHVYYWQKVYYSIDFSKPDSLADSPWLRIAEAFDNASFSGPNSKAYSDQSKFITAYAYFMYEDFEKSAKIFKKLQDSSNKLIAQNANGYIGILNLFKEISNPCSRSQAYELLRKGPKSGMLAMFKGDSYLVSDELSLGDRVTIAKECYDCAYVPPISYENNSILSNMISVRKEIMHNIILTESWKYNGYKFKRGSSTIYYYGPTDWSDKPDGWGIHQEIRNRTLIWCAFGQNIYRNGKPSSSKNLNFYLGAQIFSYVVNNVRQWGIWEETLDPYIFYTNQTPLNYGLNPYFFYDIDASPIYSPRKARKYKEKVEKMMDEEDLDYN